MLIVGGNEVFRGVLSVNGGSCCGYSSFIPSLDFKTLDFGLTNKGACQLLMGGASGRRDLLAKIFLRIDMGGYCTRNCIKSALLLMTYIMHSMSQTRVVINEDIFQAG